MQFQVKGGRETETIMNTEIGSHEAKLRFPELLRQVKAGRRFTITYRGEAIADLVPCTDKRPQDSVTAVEQLRSFMRTSRVRGVNIRNLIAEGRD